jgi:hypothetical protein
MAKQRDDRRKRVPLSGMRSKLSAPQREGYVRRWFNDTGGRLMDAENAGYEFVTDTGLQIGDPGTDGNQDTGSRVSKVVDRQENGQPMRAYLMEIKKEWYDEDQKNKQKQVDRVDEAIMGGNHENSLGARGYVPKGGIKYKP